MKAPVGLLSDRTVLRSKMEGPRPDTVSYTHLAHRHHLELVVLQRADDGAGVENGSVLHVHRQRAALFQAVYKSPVYMQRRKDHKGRVLKSGESYRKSAGLYMYCWTAKNGKRNTVYDATLEGLREKEEKIQHDFCLLYTSRCV